MARSDSSQDPSSDSSKKVAKAAKAGATPNASVGRDKRPVGFQMAMLGIVVLGTALVAFSWQARDVEALSPSFNDHWHLPYGIYDCTIDGFLPPLTDPQLANSGIHTHSDGVIHLHPFSSGATGTSATIEVFFEATTAQFDGDEALTFTDRPELVTGTECNGEEAILQVARFAPGSDTAEIFTEDLENVHLNAELAEITIALAPAGFDIPRPPAESLEAAQASSPNIFDTFGLDGLGDDSAGFNEEGQLIDSEGELILGDDDLPIDLNTLLQDQEDAEADE